ncbi:hypothetical protein B0T19DRAFT_338065, partial [Cercophora scortea]
MSPVKKIFIVGGTGAQGIPVVRGLVANNGYAVRILTRDPSSRRAQDLVALNPPKVELFQGTFTSETDLRNGYAGCEGAFINIDGFATGEKGELYWATRAYELAIESGITFYVYGNIEFTYKKSGYRPEFRAGHMDGKGRVGEWLLFQHASNKGQTYYNDMKLAIFTTGPYIEMAISAHTPMSPRIETTAEGEQVATWRVPLTAEGAVPHVSLDDCSYYVRWVFDHPSEADGRDLQAAIEHVRYADLAAAFEKVTGHKARFIDTDMETYWLDGPMSSIRNDPAGYLADASDPATMSVKENFTGFWNIFRASGGNTGLARRDYALLDEIFPGRIRSVEQFFRRQDEEARERGSSLWDMVVEMQPLLKNHDD